MKKYWNYPFGIRLLFMTIVIVCFIILTIGIHDFILQGMPAVRAETNPSGVDIVVTFLSAILSLAIIFGIMATLFDAHLN